MQGLGLANIVAAGIYNSRVAVKRASVTKNRKTVMYEIELPIEAGGVSYIDGESRVISTDTVICAKPGQIRHTRLPFKCYYLHAVVSEELSRVIDKIPNFLSFESTEQIKNIFVGMCEYYQTGTEDCELMLMSLMLRLVAILSAHGKREGAMNMQKSNRRAIEDTLEYIGNNLSADLSLDALSERTNFTPIYFHKLFRSATGKTLRAYVEEQRIKRAISLLGSTDMTLTEIAYECGFSSQSYFSYAFKRCKGVTPREFVATVYNGGEV